MHEILKSTPRHIFQVVKSSTFYIRIQLDTEKEHGYVLVKFWLHISPEEQLERFTARQHDPFKQYKLTEEDWRNREKWSLYDVAVNQAIGRTNTPTAPWTIIPANDKYYARVKVIQTVSEAVAAQLKRRDRL